MKPTTNQVREWAREAGILVPGYRDHIEHMERFAELAYTAGRDAGLELAAEVCEKYKENIIWTASDAGLVGAIKTECAAAIRLLKDDNGTN